MTRLKLFIVFFILNFGALFIGGLSTGAGVVSDWYTDLNQAPWTPPGWVFGAAWTTIMVCFTFYMSIIYRTSSNRKSIVILFSVQWILNVIWNPVFFNFHLAGLALAIISLLTIVVACFLIFFKGTKKGNGILALPYLIWLMIATSLNAYIYIYN